jgi:two-component system, NarL family, nitrate/nitrite response regulator NarL
MQLGFFSVHANVTARWGRLLSGYPARQLQAQELAEGLPGGLMLLHLDSVAPEQRWDLIQQLESRQQLFVVMVDRPQNDEGIRLLAQGARGYASTFITGSLMQQLLETVWRGDIWATPPVMQQLVKRLLNGHPSALLSVQSERVGLAADLSEREQQVLGILMTGAPNKQIARELQITERTVKAHISAILRKTGAGDRVSLILMAQERHTIH